ncbi:SMI1/KNR4 family protein [Streptomyces qinglanensis]|uniref:SMI1/KNR4 family protein n=1 Tax=Streptomyces qinglanensis TaxID=943816 RepID=UPI00379BBC6F
MNQSLVTYWENIDRWLQTHAPSSFRSLRSPATEDAVTKLEDALGVALDQEVKECFLIHDGAAETPDDEGAAYFLPRNYRLVSAEESRRLHKETNDILQMHDDQGMVGYWWHPLWLPFAESPSTDLLFVDHRPETYGQVGHFDHEDSASLRWPDLAAFLAHMVDCISGTSSDRYFQPDITGGQLSWRPVM